MLVGRMWTTWTVDDVVCGSELSARLFLRFLLSLLLRCSNVRSEEEINMLLLLLLCYWRDDDGCGRGRAAAAVTMSCC